MDLIFLPVKLAETIYFLNKLYFESQLDCQHFVKRCLVVAKVLEPLQGNEERLRSCQQAVDQLQEVLDDCLDFCSKRARRNYVDKAFQALKQSDKDIIKKLNKRISACSDDLQLAITSTLSMAGSNNNAPRFERGQVSFPFVQTI